MAATAIRADDWRLQRIRAFDWYSTELKRQTLRDMLAEFNVGRSSRTADDALVGLPFFGIRRFPAAIRRSRLERP